MRERINRLAKGIPDTDVPRVSLNPVQIDAAVGPGEISRTDITVSSENGVYLKGLAYSDHSAVKVINSSFGGMKNRITLEADARYRESGEELGGTLSLVTNGGEFTVPFLFRVSSGPAGKTLGSIRTIEDFAIIAKEDREAALRLFAYKDFVTAPFMQDLRIRCLYDAFATRSNRENALEEFLIAAHAKKPAALAIERRGITYTAVKGMPAGIVPMSVTVPGWFEFSVRTEGNFIRIEKRSVTADDFKDGHFDFPFTVDPGKLHAGDNLGSIQFVSDLNTYSVPVTVQGKDGKENREGKEEKEERRSRALSAYHERKRHFAAYADCRIRYACGGPGSEELPAKMRAELDAVGSGEQADHYLILLKAEAELLQGQTDRCRDLLQLVRPAVLAERQKKPLDYLISEYLNGMLPGGEPKRENVIRMLRKYMTEQHIHELFPLIVALDGSLRDNPAALAELIILEFASGNRSPYLYAEYVKLLSAHPELLHDLGSLELHALWFGARRDMIGADTANVIAHHAGTIRTMNRLYYPLLKCLYDRNPSRELLTSVCIVLIREDAHAPEMHRWFEQGLLQNVRLTGLYEYFLYTLPPSYDKCLPREVLAYFVYDNMLDDGSKSRLYANIVRYLKPESKLWEEYGPQVAAFTEKEALAGKIDGNLSELYRFLIRSGKIDEKLARAMIPILHSREITTAAQGIRSVAVFYPELKEPTVCSLDHGKACVPVFTERAVLLFQNAYGNRYYSIPYEARQICEAPELLQKCENSCPDHPAVRLRRLRETLAKEKRSAEETAFLERAEKELPLAELYRREILAAVVADSLENPDFLLRADRNRLTGRERREVCTALIRTDHCREAYEIMKSYGCTELEPQDLKVLCSKMILDRLFTEDRLLLWLADRTLTENGGESVILDYLCEHYNGTSDEMFRILTFAIGAHAETYDMEERLLAQMLFTGSDRNMDQVFRWYVNRKTPGESIVRAYLTLKCENYFLKDGETDASVFERLEKLYDGLTEKENFPVLYRLALTRYYASLPELSADRRKYASDLVAMLLGDRLVFPYYRSLSRFAAVPGDVLDRTMVEYRASADARAEIRVRILPGETAFRPGEMKRMYAGIFVCSEVLFSGETLEYEIYETGGPAPVLKDKGSIRKAETGGPTGGSRFDRLNDLTVKADRKDEQGVREGMLAFAVQEGMISELFGLTQGDEK